MYQPPVRIYAENQSESDRIKKLAEKELYPMVFDV